MAEIKIYRSETQRVTPGTQPLALRAPDLSGPGVASMEIGNFLTEVGKVRGDLAATAEADAALKGYQTDLLGVTREARRQKPKDAEAYYLRESAAAYKKHAGPLGKLAGSMFAKPAGQSGLSSRSSFYKENDARLQSVAIASSDGIAQSYMPIVTNIGADEQSRFDAFEGAQWQYQDQYGKGYIDAETNIANQRDYAENALESILRQHMLRGKNDDDWDPSGVMDRFLAGTLGDNVADELAKLIKPEDLIKITDAAMDQAVSMETEVRKAAAEDDRADKKRNDRLFATIFSAAKTPEGKQKAMDAYLELKGWRGFETLADRDNAEKMLGYLGFSEFATDEVASDTFRTSKQGSSRSALMSLEALHSKRTLTHAAVNNMAGRLTEAAFKAWHAKVDAEHSEEFTQMKYHIDTAFDFIKNQDVGDDFEKKHTLFAYTTALGRLEEYERDNPHATSMQLREKAQQFIKEGKQTLTDAAQLDWDYALTLTDHTGMGIKTVLQPITGDPKYTNGGTPMQRADHYIAGLGEDTGMELGVALEAKRKILFYQRWNVDMTKGLPQ